MYVCEACLGKKGRDKQRDGEAERAIQRKSNSCLDFCFYPYRVVLFGHNETNVLLGEC